MPAVVVEELAKALGARSTAEIAPRRRLRAEPEDGIWVWGCGRICGEMYRISCRTRMSTARSRGSARTRKAMLQLHA